MASPTDATASRLDEAVEDAADEARSTLERLRAQAGEAVDGAVERIRPQIDAVSDYVREEPTKALLFSAAAGAALIGIVALLVRGSSRPALVAPGRLSSIRDVALGFADRAHGLAGDYLDAAQSRARQATLAARAAKKAADKARKSAASAIKTAHDTAGGLNEKAGYYAEKAGEMADRAKAMSSDASDMAESASERVVEAWETLRDQAAPVVDRLRPQFEAAARYARDDPAKAAIGVVAAGAVIAGLVALARSSER